MTTLTTLAKYTSIGSYPLGYLDGEDNTLCAECASEETGKVTPFINYENASCYCDECSTRIESAYAGDV